MTYAIFPAEEDVLSITWMETMLRALAVSPGPMAFEHYGTSGKVWVRLAVPHQQVPGLHAALLGQFPALCLREIVNPLPDEQPAAINELVPVPPYHRSFTLLGEEGASPLGIATIALAALTDHEHGVFQMLRSSRTAWQGSHGACPPWVARPR